MIQALCPYCYRSHQWRDILAETTVRCPDCAHFYNADPWQPPPQRPVAAPVSAPAVGPPPPAAWARLRFLTSAHTCSQCQGPVEEVLDRRRRTLPCPHCHRVTTVYAVLHRCPACDARLESPSGQVEGESDCPACGFRLTVPADLLGIDAGPTEDRAFAFACSHCDGRALTSPRAAGRLAVCPHCERPLTVPHVGEALRAADRRAGLDGPTTHCSHCHLEIPKSVAQCPYCEARDPFGL